MTNILQSYEIVQFCNLINYEFTKFTMFTKFTSLHVCKIVNRMQLTVFNITYNHNVTKFQLYNVRSTRSKLQLQCKI